MMARADALGEQERGASVQHVMQPEPVQASPLPLVPAPVHVPRLETRPDRRRQHQPVLPPSVARRQVLSILPLLVL
jgi:hypothetical protein